MVTTEMAIVLPLILVLLVSLLFFFIYIVYGDLIEISANTLLFQKLYGASINNSKLQPPDDLMIEKTPVSRKFSLSRTYSVDFPDAYPDTITKRITYRRYNPRIFLLMKVGGSRIINRDMK
ncbi:hypothetical protein [Fusibacter sp. 3D3]|uniref:hypothetical protein n=1 Tax=Fusibacter sp. 3D3 TaxID=1048380 RepID=UPI0008535B35|nr:hypothetical protein [Fusibacter sp. 3D3]